MSVEHPAPSTALGDSLRQLSEWLAATDISGLELRGPHGTLRVGQWPTAAAEGVASSVAEATAAPAAAATVVRAGSVGQFLHAHPLHSDALVRVGDAVAAGQVVGLLRIGSVLLGVPAPRAGMVVRLQAAHGQVVGWGDALIDIG